MNTTPRTRVRDELADKRRRTLAQQASGALASLDPADQIEIATAALVRNGMPFIAWDRSAFEAEAINQNPDATRREIRAIADRAYKNAPTSGLVEPTAEHWKEFSWLIAAAGNTIREEAAA